MNDDAKPRMRYGPLRLIAPWIAMTVGIFLTVRGATGAMNAIFLIVGPALILLGITAFFVYRWMAKRGI